MINPSELNLSSLPWLPLEAKAAFPRQPAIYFAIDSQDNVQYIGRSVDPKSRWAGHHRYEQLEAIGSIRIAYLFIDLPKLLPEIEKALIGWFQPPLNVVGRSMVGLLPVDRKPVNEEPCGDRLRDRLRFVAGKDYRVSASGHSSVAYNFNQGYYEDEYKSPAGKVLYIAQNEMSDEDLLAVGLDPSQVVDGNFGDPESIDAIADYLGLIKNAFLDGLHRICRNRIATEKGYLADQMETVAILRSMQQKRLNRRIGFVRGVDFICEDEDLDNPLRWILPMPSRSSPLVGSGKVVAFLEAWKPDLEWNQVAASNFFRLVAGEYKDQIAEWNGRSPTSLDWHKVSALHDQAASLG